MSREYVLPRGFELRESHAREASGTSDPERLEVVQIQLAAELVPEGSQPLRRRGLLVGPGAVVISLGIGIAAGVSTFLESTLSHVSNQSRLIEIAQYSHNPYIVTAPTKG